MVQQLVPGSRILENTWMTHIFSTQKLIHGLEIIGPGKHWSFDIIWSFWNEIKASPISLCVGLGASSCNLASYAGALTSTTNQTPQTPGPLVQAPLVESLTTHLNSDSRNSTHPQHSSRFSSKAQVSQFQIISSHCWYPTLCCPKEDTKEDAYNHEERLHKHAQTKSGNVNDCPSPQKLHPGLSCGVRIFCGYALHSALLRFVLIWNVTKWIIESKWKVKHFVLLFAPECKHCSRRNAHQQAPKWIKGFQRYEPASAIELQGQLQTFAGWCSVSALGALARPTSKLFPRSANNHNPRPQPQLEM